MTIEKISTVADGLAAPFAAPTSQRLIERYVDEVIAVPEEAITHAMVFLLERSKMVVEGAGALGAAALLAGAYRPAGETVVVLSGGNVDMNLVGSVIRSGLADAGRYQELAIEMSDMPGELAALTAAIARAGGNVIEVEHRREAPGLPVGVAIVEFLLEVNGSDHFRALVEALHAEGVLAVDGAHPRLATASARSREHNWRGDHV